jgi:hypothetical protein
MAYNNLNGIKLINGLPADLNAFNKLIENDSFFKTVSDTDEDLAAVDRNIIPLTTDVYALGSLSKYFKDLFVTNINSQQVSITPTSTTVTALNFGSEVNGFFRPASGRLSYKTGTIIPLALTPTMVKVSAANRDQLVIESTEINKEGSWALGADKDEFSITSLGTSIIKVLRLLPDQIIAEMPFRSQSGSQPLPGYSFATDAAMGMYKDLQTLGFSTAGAKRLELTDTKVLLYPAQLVAQEGTPAVPSYTFEGALDSGFSVDTNKNIILSVLGLKVMEFNATGAVSVSGIGATITSRTFSDTGTSSLALERGRGTTTAHTAIVNTDVLGLIRADGFVEMDGIDEVYSTDATQLQFIAQDNFTAAATGTYIDVLTTQKGQNVSARRLTIGKDDRANVHCPGSFGVIGSTVTGPLTATTIDVLNKSKLLVNTTPGTVQIKGFTNGKEGQILHIVKLNQTGTLELLHNDATAVQSVWLKGSASYQLVSSYGGIILSFDNGQWREVSRS